ncbi:MAG: Flp1 family type IVb pilin [Lachnospiraceae bacterium]|jgi:Flp pilus assembly pilin Flp
MGNVLKEFMDDQEGMGTVEIILIIVVLISLVIVFRTEITKVVNNVMTRITTKSNQVR